MLIRCVVPFTLVMLLLAILGFGSIATENAEEFTLSEVGFRVPACILHDAKADVYLVSNINGQAGVKDNNGFISRISSEGEVIALKWIDSATEGVTLHAPTGMAIFGDELYVADVQTLRVFDRNTGELLENVYITNAKFLMDVAIGLDGLIYVSDIVGIIYCMHVDRTITSVKTFHGCSGIVATEDLLFAANWSTGQIIRINLESGDSTTFACIRKAKLFGLVLLDDGILLVSSSGASAVFQVDPHGWATQVFSKLSSPLYIGYDSTRGLVLIPLPSTNQVVARLLPESTACFGQPNVVPPPTDSSLRAVWATETGSLFTVAEDGAILFYDGAAWSERACVTERTLLDIWGAHENSVLCVTERTLLDIWGAHENSVFAVGMSGTILHYDGTMWSAMSIDTTESFSAVWGSGAEDVFVVGSYGAIWHYDGKEWSSMSSGTESHLRNVWGTSPRHVIAVGDDGTILHYDGIAWCAVPVETNRMLTSVWGASEHDVFVVGAYGEILHYNGYEWVDMVSGDIDTLIAVWGEAYDSVFAVGGNGTVLHYNGREWRHVPSGTYSTLYDVTGTSEGLVVAVGEEGTAIPIGRTTIVVAPVGEKALPVDLLRESLSWRLERYGIGNITAHLLEGERVAIEVIGNLGAEALESLRTLLVTPGYLLFYKIVEGGADRSSVLRSASPGEVLLHDFTGRPFLVADEPLLTGASVEDALVRNVYRPGGLQESFVSLLLSDVGRGVGELETGTQIAVAIDETVWGVLEVTDCLKEVARANGTAWEILPTIALGVSQNEARILAALVGSGPISSVVIVEESLP